jgi:death on curing protein
MSIISIAPIFLTLDEALEMHQKQIDLYGGSHGLRDAAGLESALAMPQATFDGKWLHPSIPAMGAAYLFHLCQNHAFIDGNKRIAAHAADVFLLMNDLTLEFSEKELVDVVLAVASGVLGKQELTKMIAARCQHT